MITSLKQIIQVDTFKTSVAVGKNRNVGKSYVLYWNINNEVLFSIIFRNSPNTKDKYLFS